MVELNLAGIIPYLVSPVDKETGKVKTEALKRLSKDLVAKGVHGLSPLGSVGEVHYLTWEQKTEIVRTVVETSNGQVPVIPGVSSYTPEDAINQINHFEKLGVNGAVLILNTYFKLSRENIIELIRKVANAVAIPLVLYNNPQFSNVDLTPDIVIELSSLPNIKYFKDATGDTGRLLSIINNAGDDIEIFSASAHIPLFVMQLGGLGWMAAPACVFPEQAVRLYKSVRSKQWDNAMEIQRQLWRVNEIFKKYNPAACIKGALQLQGYDVGSPVSPVNSLSDSDKSIVQDVINSISKRVK